MGGCVGSEKPKPTGQQIPKKDKEPAPKLANDNVPKSASKVREDRLNNRIDPKPEGPVNDSSIRDRIIEDWKNHPQRFDPEASGIKKNKNSSIEKSKGRDGAEDGDQIVNEDKPGYSPIKQIDVPEAQGKNLQEKQEKPSSLYPTLNLEAPQQIQPQIPQENEQPITKTIDSGINVIYASESNDQREGTDKKPKEVNITSTDRRNEHLSNLKAISEVNSFMENQGDSVKKNKDKIDEIFQFDKQKKTRTQIKEIANNYINSDEPIDRTDIIPGIIGEKGPQSELLKVEMLDIAREKESQPSRMFGEQAFFEDYQVDFQIPIFQIAISS